MMRLAVVRFWYEGNAFSPIPASADAFRNREWVAGSAAATFYRGTNVEVAAVDGFIKENQDIEAHYILCTAAYPAGPMEPGLFNEMMKAIDDGLAEHEWDGVYVSLHGSAVTKDAKQPELELLKRMRDRVGNAPIAVTLDLHANINPALGDLADIVVGYKTYPHIDMLETGAKALTLLGRAMRNEIKPKTTIVQAEFAPTSFRMQTDNGPMADMVTLAHASEQANGYYDVSTFGGFVYADSPDTGASISLCAEANTPNVATEAARLAKMFADKAELFVTRLPPPASVLTRLKNELAEGERSLPVAVLEPSDNVFSGGGADTPGLLRQALECGLDAPAIFAFFWDPDLVKLAHNAGPDATIKCAFGGRLSKAFGQPVPVTAKVERLTDGRFVNQGPMEKGFRVDLGPTAVLKVGKLRIIVTSHNAPVNDMAYFTLHGLSPKDFTITFTKAKNHFRAAFANVFERIIEVETPGPASSDLSSFDFQNAPYEKLFPPSLITDASHEDAGAIAALHAASWRKFYKGILPQTYLSEEVEAERLHFWRQKLGNLPQDELVLVKKNGNSLGGFIWLTPRTEPGYDAVIEALHVNFDQRGSGIGKKLLASAARRLLADGAKSVCLRVFDANEQAVAFYKRLGGIPDHAGIDSFAGCNAPDTRFGWSDIRVLLAACEDIGHTSAPPFNPSRNDGAA